MPTEFAGCRSGAPLGTPSRCPAPIVSREEAEELGVARRWCRQHAETLAAVKRELRERGRPSSRRYSTGAPVTVRHAGS